MAKATKEETDVIVNKAIVMMKDKSFAEICDELGYAYNTLQHALRRRGHLISMIKLGYKKAKLSEGLM
tara:strand:- start:8515 stop:8718 length:204 start_codon:yes stop_codon:yes gene_type:complete